MVKKGILTHKGSVRSGGQLQLGKLSALMINTVKEISHAQ
jgi:hypothetical protein